MEEAIAYCTGSTRLLVMGQNRSAACCKEVTERSTAQPGGGKTNAGTIFKLDKDGTGYEILHSFIWVDGRVPLAGLIEGRDGALYGTASEGGRMWGTIFKLNKDGSGFSVVYAFAGPLLDGRGPQGPVTEGSDGALYGTVSGGGKSGAGIVFKVSEDGSSYEILLTFNGPNGS